MNLPKLPVFDANSPLRPARFGHIVLKSPKFAEMTAWYKRFLNAEAMFENPLGAFLTYDDEHHRVFILNAPGASPRDPDAAGLAHFAYLFNSLGDLLSAYERLKGEGVSPAYCVNHGFQLSFYYNDPDGNEAELGCDVFPTREELDRWFQNGAFAANVFGYMFSAEKVLAAHKAGATDAALFEGTYQNGEYQ
jgi:catechol-2,3-dioxygenase